MLNIKELKRETLQLLEHGEMPQKINPGLAEAFAGVIKPLPDFMTEEDGSEIKNALEILLSFLKDLESGPMRIMFDFRHKFPPGKERDEAWRLFGIELKRRMRAAAKQ